MTINPPRRGDVRFIQLGQKVQGIWLALASSVECHSKCIVGDLVSDRRHWLKDFLSFFIDGFHSRR